MTLLERLRSHKGGLLRLKTQLFWYDGRGWDKDPGRICLILDAATDADGVWSDAAAAVPAVVFRAAPADAAAHLLIDGQPQWVWVAEQDAEVIDED